MKTKKNAYRFPKQVKRQIEGWRYAGLKKPKEMSVTEWRRCFKDMCEPMEISNK